MTPSRGDIDLASASSVDDTIAWYRNDEGQDPTVDGGGPYTVASGQTVSLTATGDDPDGGAVTFAWDLDNDGTFADAAGTTVTYDSTVYGTPGANTVTVQVTDDENVTATDTATVTITTPPTVDAGGPYTVASGDTVPLTATGTDPDGGAVTFAWDLDNDGTFDNGTGTTVAYDTTVYGTPGANTITVQITDDEGQTTTDTATVTVTVTSTPPVSIPTEPTEPSEPPVTVDPAEVSTATETDDAIQAAIDLSQLRFTNTDGFTQQQRATPYVVVARVDLFADALGGSVLTDSAPLLYTAADTLDPRTATEIDRVLSTNGTVYLLGGTAALSQSIQQTLTDAGYVTVRLAGASRVETALAIADLAITQGQAPTQAALARADAPADTPTAAWADAITAGGWAANTSSPILLTQTGTLHPAVADWLTSHPDINVSALGGTAALTDTTVEAAGATRITGTNRYDTASQIADTLWPTNPVGYLIANGTATDAWAFTLAAAGIAADLHQPTLLVDSDRLPPETATHLCQTGNRADTTTIGSDRLITQAVRDQLTTPCP